jgi:hypothetical protein
VRPLERDQVLVHAADHEQRRREQLEIRGFERAFLVGGPKRPGRSGPPPRTKRLASALQLIGDVHDPTLIPAQAPEGSASSRTQVGYSDNPLVWTATDGTFRMLICLGAGSYDGTDQRTRRSDPREDEEVPELDPEPWRLLRPAKERPSERGVPRDEFVVSPV